MTNFRGVLHVFKSQFLGSLRSKESVFFAIFLPPILFIVFGLAFNVNGEYAIFFLPGMIGSIFTSDSLFAVGPVIKNYYILKIVRHFRNYPLNIAWLFIAFIFTRLVLILISSLILMFLSIFLFDYTPDFVSLIRYLTGIIIGFSIYSLLALTISFYGIEDNKDQGLLSIFYFMSIFLSDAFFVLSKINVMFDAIGYLFPLKVVLNFMRGDIFSLVYCLLWLVFAFVIFNYRVNKIQLKRI